MSRQSAQKTPLRAGSFYSLTLYHISIISAVMSKQNERAEKDRQLRENKK